MAVPYPQLAQEVDAVPALLKTAVPVAKIAALMFQSKRHQIDHLPARAYF